MAPAFRSGESQIGPRDAGAARSLCSQRHAIPDTLWELWLRGGDGPNFIGVLRFCGSMDDTRRADCHRHRTRPRLLDVPPIAWSSRGAACTATAGCRDRRTAGRRPDADGDDRLSMRRSRVPVPCTSRSTGAHAGATRAASASVACCTDATIDRACRTPETKGPQLGLGRPGCGPVTAACASVQMSGIGFVVLPQSLTTRTDSRPWVRWFSSFMQTIEQ